MRKPDGSRHTQLDFGDYCRGIGEAADWWVFRTPNGIVFSVHAKDAPKYHQLTEHEDGTVTLSPSVLTSCGHLSYHGFLERGAWRSC